MKRYLGKGLLLQPRMGFSDINDMSEGLRETQASGVPVVGTITLDSFTRTNQYGQAESALVDGSPLNGYPLVAHGAERTRQLVEDSTGNRIPIQIRHGSARPYEIFQVMLDAGIDMTEGGPVSYCLPYGRVPLAESVEEWTRSVRLLASHQSGNRVVHLESFGGCMLGQLCPPDLLVALTILEALFFREHGLHDVSLSYAQQTHAGQDLEALAALRALAGKYLHDMDWHVVVYTYMGLYPETRAGADRLLAQSALLVRWAGCERLVVKTAQESRRIPTVAENIASLRLADEAFRDSRAEAPPAEDGGILERAELFVSTVLGLGSGVGPALLAAFRRGVLDVPYCLHPDNAGRARSGIDEDGRLIWTDPGGMPIRRSLGPLPSGRVRAADVLAMLSYVRRAFDRDGPT
ncbi:methylaspartate mutase [Streptomyces anulatus]|uniref:methylaspartate mutase n=1 Tax=Streptomyces anulatus TaxID=1892 RepID=UPI0036953C5D